MSREKGLLQTCDRCGATNFCKCIGKGVTDGGFTTWDKFEDSPAGWGSHYGLGLLCPACNAEYTETIVAFMQAGRPKPDGA